MKQRQIAALALACMLILTSFTTYAENGTNSENTTLLSNEVMSQEVEGETTALASEEPGTDSLEVSESEVETISSEETENAVLETECEETTAKETETETITEESETVVEAKETESETSEEESETAVEGDEAESETIVEEETEAAETILETSEEESEPVVPEKFNLTSDNKGDFLDPFDPSILIHYFENYLELNYLDYYDGTGIEKTYYCLWDSEYCYSLIGLPFTDSFTDLPYASVSSVFCYTWETECGLSLFFEIEDDCDEPRISQDLTLGIVLKMEDGSCIWDTLNIWGNDQLERASFISVKDFDSLIYPMEEEEFFITYPAGITKEDIEGIYYCLWWDDHTYSINGLPYFHGRSNAKYNGAAQDTNGCETDQGIVLSIGKAEEWYGMLSVVIRTKKGQIFHDNIQLWAMFFGGDFRLYLEKGQTVCVNGLDIGLCEKDTCKKDSDENGFYAENYKICDNKSADNYDSLIKYTSISENQDSSVDLNGVTFQREKYGYLFSGDEIGEYSYYIKAYYIKAYYCSYEVSWDYHPHAQRIRIIVYDRDDDTFESGLYDNHGNLIRSFEETQVPADEDSETEEETIVDTVDKSENSSATEKEEEASEKDDTTSTNSTNSAASSDSSTSKVDSPATGDPDAMRIIFLMISLTCCISFALETKKRFSGKN